MRSYTRGDTEYRVAAQSDDGAIRGLLNSTSMDSWISISVQREPRYFDGCKIYSRSVTVVAKKLDGSSDMVGMYSCSQSELFYGGKIQNIPYLGLLRVKPKYRGKIRYLKDGFASIREIVDFDSTVDFIYTSIATQNSRAKRILEANIDGMPQYLPIANLSTFTFAAGRFGCRYKILKASDRDIDSIAEFYNASAKRYDFAPVLRSSWLKSLNKDMGLDIGDFYLVKSGSGQIEAMFAIWDQRRFKQFVVDSYRYPLDRLRPLYNLYAKFTKSPPLPPAKEQIEQVFVSFLALSKRYDTVDILKCAARVATEYGAKVCSVAFDSRDPVSPAIKRELKAAVYNTDIEAIFLDRENYFRPKVGLIRPEIALL